MSDPDHEWDVATWLVASGRSGEVGDPLNVPIVAASSFVSDGSAPYSRGLGTPGWEAFETAVGGLEKGTSVSFASGMAAVAAIIDQVPAGGVLAVPTDCYQGVTTLARRAERLGRLSVIGVATDDTAGWIAAAAEADMVWFESPSNPLVVIGDLGVVAAAPRRGLLVVDNTFATPLNQQPLDVGADVSMQSATKLIGGHSDLLAGVATTRDPELAEALRTHRSIYGATPGALESFLALRGLRTLALRLRRSEETAAELAERLDAHPAVEIVRYPGLAAHPGHELAARTMTGFGSMLSFDVVGGGPAADRVCAGTDLIVHATSLGGVESTLERRATIPGQEHLPAGLIRLSVGIEHVDDLWSDLVAALG